MKRSNQVTYARPDADRPRFNRMEQVPGGSPGTMYGPSPNPARTFVVAMQGPADDKAMSKCGGPSRDMDRTGNGTLHSISPRMPNRKQYRWKATNPLPTYMVSIAATDYVKFSQTYTDWMAHHAHRVLRLPQQLRPPVLLFNVPPMMWHFTRTFGEYPFAVTSTDEQRSVGRSHGARHECFLRLA